MLQRELLEKSGEPGFTIGQKEKDYVQHWVLSYLGRAGFLGVFKGGTALQKAYLLPRYSEDLDFSLNGASLPDFDAISRYLESAGFGAPNWKKKNAKISYGAKLKVQGLLYNGREISECALSFDFSVREKAILPARSMEIRPPYPDIVPYSVLIMDPVEMAAEKVRAILTRVSARDLYDLAFLIRLRATPNAELVEKKLSSCGVAYSYDSFAGKAGKLSKVWKVEMSAFVSHVPEYKAILGEVLGAMKGI